MQVQEWIACVQQIEKHLGQLEGEEKALMTKFVEMCKALTPVVALLMTQLKVPISPDGKNAP